MWNELERFCDRLDELRRFLRVSAALEGEPVLLRSATREARASAIVCSVAEFEALMAACVIFVNKAINKRRVVFADLCPPLRSLAAHSDFVSLLTLAKADKFWPKRQHVTSLESCRERVELRESRGGREPLPPFDGSTLRLDDIERVFNVYGVPTTGLSITDGAVALRKLADARNEIAHANEPLSAVFSKKGFRVEDIDRDLDALESMSLAIVEAFERYVDSDGYLGRASSP